MAKGQLVLLGIRPPRISIKNIQKYISQQVSMKKGLISIRSLQEGISETMELEISRYKVRKTLKDEIIVAGGGSGIRRPLLTLPRM
jgi:hypothetical protein